MIEKNKTYTYDELKKIIRGTIRKTNEELSNLITKDEDYNETSALVMGLQTMAVLIAFECNLFEEEK